LARIRNLYGPRLNSTADKSKEFHKKKFLEKVKLGIWTKIFYMLDLEPVTIERNGWNDGKKWHWQAWMERGRIGRMKKWNDGRKEG
jgi:hypothetical protein